jgi:hypothetical protein
MTDPLELTETELRELLRNLLDAWRDERGLGQRFGSTSHAAVVATVHSLVAHAHGLGRAVLTLHDAGFGVEIVPLVRAMFEATISAAWLAQIPDGVPAFMNYNRSQQKKTAA